MAKRAATVLGFVAGMLCTTAFADTDLVRSGPYANTDAISITGEITERDAAYFASHSKEFSYKRPKIFLNSRGGDVDAAMKIGRIIRSADGETTIDGLCYSSCALIFIAGVIRFNLGELGLHRPYLAAAPLGRAEIEKRLPIVRSTVKAYVQEMGITDTFFERMFNTDPSGMEIYRGSDLEKIVPATDPVYDEILTSHAAQQYGLTTAEYRKRLSLAGSCLSITRELKVKSKYPDCHEATMWNLSPEVYRSRAAMVKTRCNFSESDRQVLNATPTKDQHTLPFVVQYYACQLSTMSGK